MEITIVVAMFTVLIGMVWRLERKIDKAAADHRADLNATETALRGEIQTTRTELANQIDKMEIRLSGEIQAVGNKVETLENRVGHYEQRISYAEAKLNLELGATRQDNPTAA